MAHTRYVQTTRPHPQLLSIVLVSCVIALSGCSRSEGRYPSPDGQREVVIDVGIASIDTVWTVSVREAAPLGHRRDIGCFTDDDPDSGTPTSVTWTDAGEFVIKTTADDAGVRVLLNPDGSASQVTQGGHDFLTPCPWS